MSFAPMTAFTPGLAMFSRAFALSILVLVSSAFLGCSLPMFENPPETEDLQVSLGDATACLSDVMPLFGEYFSGTARDAQVIGMWDCVSAAVSTFEKSTAGRYEDRFTSRELAHFIEQYFLAPGERIPDSLLVEVFRIKQLFVGGSLDSISRAEMKDLSSVIRDLKRITLGLNGYMKIYTFHWKERDLNFSDADVQVFDQADVSIQQAAKDLAAVIKRNGQPYHLRDAVVLLRELSNFSAKPWPWIATVEKAMPLVEKLKKDLTGGEPGDIAPSEWERFTLLGARGLIQYLRYHYFIESADLKSGGPQLTYFMDSVRDLFSFLGDMVAQKPGQALTRAELFEMIQAISDFIPAVKVSDQLLIEAMKLKVVFFGGGLDRFVKDDFDRASRKLQTFEAVTRDFLAYSDVYGQNWKSSSLPVGDARNYFKKAEDGLDNFGRALGAIMESSYDLNDLTLLATEIDRLYPSTNPDGKSLQELAQKFVPVAVAIKNIIFSDQGGVVGKTQPGDQWKTFFETATGFYSRYLFYNYFLSTQEITDGSGLVSLALFKTDLIAKLDHLILQKPAKMISFGELSHLWSTLIFSEIMPADISLKTLDGLTKVILQKWLVPPDVRLAGQVPNGLTVVATQTLQAEIQIWIENQRLLGQVYKGVPADAGQPGSAVLAALNSAPQTEALKELKVFYSGRLPLSFDEIGRWYLSQPAKNYRHAHSNVINLVRSAVRLVVRSYAMNLDRTQTTGVGNGIMLAEAKSLFEDVKPLVMELRLLSSSTKDFAENRFRDANLFTSVGNGDDVASFDELSNLAVMIVSGIKIDSLMFADLEKNCAITKPGPLKETWTVKLDCLTKYYAQEMPIHFSSMPDFMNFQSSLDDTRFSAMFLGLLKATGTIIDANNNVNVGDLVLFPNVVQYLEGIFQIYDTDRNGLLNTSECLKAYPTYRSILLQVSGLKDEQQLKGLFTWLLKYGKPPTGADQLKFIVWWVPKGESGWDVNANREMLAKILGFIADSINNQPKPMPATNLWHINLENQN